MYRRPKFITILGYSLFVFSIYLIVTALWAYDPHPNTYSPLAATPPNGWYLLSLIICRAIALASAVLILRGQELGRWLFIVYCIGESVVLHFSWLAPLRVELYIVLRYFTVFLLYLPISDSYFEAEYKTNR